MKRVFDTYPQCPCLMKQDMESSQDVYEFIEENYGKIDSYNWESISLSNTECAYCLLCEALKIVQKDKIKYGEKKISLLIQAKNITMENFLYKVLDKIYTLTNREK